jgi:tight adherence protein C
MLDEINMAGKTIQNAINNLEQRVNMPEMTAFCSVLQMAFQYGGSRMSEMLVEQANAIRTERVLRAENYINQTSSKMLFPIAVFILPGIFVTLVGPMALTAYLNYFHK